MVQYFGIPTYFVYERNPRFISDFWKSFKKLLRSPAIATFAHHPKADGQTEYINHTIGKIFCAYLLDENQEHWPNHMLVIEMAINSTINASI